MTDIRIMNIESEHSDLLQEVKLLFSNMYDEMAEFGLLLPLHESGPEKWMNGISPTLGRMSVLSGAFDGKSLIGFAHGSLRFLPDYLGNHLTGVVTHIYVKPSFRKKKAAKQLLQNLEEWFLKKGTTSIDLQVVSANEPAIAFWERNGYQSELKQYRKFLK